MASIQNSLDNLLTADGALCAAVVDSTSGMMLGAIGSGVDLEVAAAGNTEVMRAKLKTMRALGLNDSIEDILITLGKQYHLLRPMAQKEGCSSTSCSTSRSRTWRWRGASCRRSRRT